MASTGTIRPCRVRARNPDRVDCRRTPQGNPEDAPRPLEFVDGWRIGKPDVVIEIPKPFNVPPTGVVPYQYISVPTGFTEDRWVEAIEIRPSNRKVVHHINASAQPRRVDSAGCGLSHIRPRAAATEIRP